MPIGSNAGIVVGLLFISMLMLNVLFWFVYFIVMLFQVNGVVPTITIDKSDGCQMYLSPDSLNVEIVSSKSSEMNVLIPSASGDYVSVLCNLFSMFI